MTLTKRIISVDPNNPDEKTIDIAASLLLAGKIVIYPTDTTYAIGVNALNPTAIEALFQLKGRAADKPIHVVIANILAAENIAVLNQAAKLLANKYLPGPLTLIMQKKEIVPATLVGGLKTLGIRIPDNKVCLNLAHKAGIPFTTTSANISGGENPYSVDDVVEQFGSKIELVDLIIDQGPLLQKPPSTVLDLTTPYPQILRDGPISGAKLLMELKDQT